ncbi:hypothetical protein TNCT_484091 [Trichonephila clavata]|uniref:Uncharacterized protein n=1 Tax=Trichonephila clavata TaxID=2740835 RepID=A0A8X6JAI3_TRICU|nr:hypothetical protein TNCT_484091 [Trichonephila clavata]
MYASASCLKNKGFGTTLRKTAPPNRVAASRRWEGLLGEKLGVEFGAAVELSQFWKRPPFIARVATFHCFLEQLYDMTS